MSKPYVYTDPEGDFLAISQCELGVHVSVRPAGDGMGSFAACVRPEDVRKVTTAMHEQAGQPDRWAALRAQVDQERTGYDDAIRNYESQHYATRDHEGLRRAIAKRNAVLVVLAFMDDLEAGL